MDVLRLRRHYNLGRRHCTLVFCHYLPVRTRRTIDLACYTTRCSNFPRQTSRVARSLRPLRDLQRLPRGPREIMRGRVRLDPFKPSPVEGGAKTVYHFFS
jgi:hypothetical protein